MKIIELFGGIGAPKKAFKNLGIDTESIYVENNKKVVNVYNLLYNKNETPKDIKEIKLEKDNYDFLIGGFPCQPFSHAGKKLGFLDPRGTLYKDTLRIIEETLPNNIILENVKGLLQEKNKWIVDEIINFLENLNYSVIYKVINSYDFGNIQKRKRVFIIASKIKKLNLKYFEFYLENNKKTDKINVVEEFFNEKEKIHSINLNEIKDAGNYFVIPRKTDGKLISGSYNRVWNYKNAIGTITTSFKIKIGLKKDDKLYYRDLTPEESFLHMGFDEFDYNLIKDKGTYN